MHNILARKGPWVIDYLRYYKYGPFKDSASRVKSNSYLDDPKVRLGHITVFSPQRLVFKRVPTHRH